MRMGIGLDCIILRRKPERVKAHREKDIVSLHSAFAGNHFQTGICLNMPDMHSGSRRIRKFHQAIKLRFCEIIFCGKALMLFPEGLPFLFNSGKVITFCHRSYLSIVKTVPII